VVRLASSRANPGGNRSGIGLKDRNGIGAGCRVRNKMQRLKWGAGLCVGLRQAAIFVDREGTVTVTPVYSGPPKIAYEATLLVVPPLPVLLGV